MGTMLGLLLAAGLLSAEHALRGRPVPRRRRFRRWAARRRAAGRRPLWPCAVDLVADRVRSGSSLPRALAAVGECGPEPLRPAFAAFGADHGASGRTAEALDRLRDRLDDPVADQLVATVRMVREIDGADAGTVLRTLSALLREEACGRSEPAARCGRTAGTVRFGRSRPESRLPRPAPRVPWTPMVSRRPAVRR